MFSFFAMMFVAIFAEIVFVGVKYGVPLARFIRKAQSVIQLYNFLSKIVLVAEKEGKVDVVGNHSISCENVTVQFKTLDEAMNKIESMAKETLESYNQLHMIFQMDSTVQDYKKKLTNICGEIRVRKWRKQGI